MDTSKAKKKNTKTNEKNYVQVLHYGVDHVRCVSGKNGDTVFFSLTLNGVTINGCHVATNKSGEDFIAFPQNKGKDGNYYSIVYVLISPEDQQKILDTIQDALNMD